MNLNRRQFLTTAAAAGAGFLGLRNTPLAYAQSGSANDHCLVVCFLRGGMDGLNVVAPVDDADYIAARPTGLRIAPNGDAAGLSIKNGLTAQDWRMSASVGALKELYDSGQLAMIHATGLRNGSRSHFEAQDLIDQGAAEGQTGKQKSGWLTRYVQQMQFGSELPVVSLGSASPKSLLGWADAVAMQSVEQFGLTGNAQVADRFETMLASFYTGTDPIALAGAKTLATMNAIEARIPRSEGFGQGQGNGRGQGKGKNKGNNKRPAEALLNGTPRVQNQGALPGQLSSISKLREEGFGLRVATVDIGGWDHHYAEESRLRPLLQNTTNALHAWWTGLPAATQNATTVVLISEFGRRVKANQSAGTDHGHGNVMFVLGGGIAGGRMYGQWPGLATEQLDNQVDLAITTDYRAVLGEVLARRGGCPDASAVFPGIEKSWLGLA